MLLERPIVLRGVPPAPFELRPVAKTTLIGQLSGGVGRYSTREDTTLKSAKHMDENMDTGLNLIESFLHTLDEQVRKVLARRRPVQSRPSRPG